MSVPLNNFKRKNTYEKPLGTGGGSGIRTHGTLERTTVFETAPFDRSGIPPSVMKLAEERKRFKRERERTCALHMLSLKPQRLFELPEEGEQTAERIRKTLLSNPLHTHCL